MNDLCRGDNPLEKVLKNVNCRSKLTSLGYAWIQKYAGNTGLIC